MNTIGGTGSLSTAHRTYSSLAAQRVRQMIADGRLQPGDRLNEAELADDLEISRGPLREAIQRLASEGLVISRSHKGAFVRVFSAAEVQELYELMFALEKYSIEAAAPEDRKALGERLVSLVDDPDRKGTWVVQASELEFHRQIAAISGNASLIDAHEITLQKLELALVRPQRIIERAEEVASEHLSIATTIATGTADAAGVALREHLVHSVGHAHKALAAAPS